MVYPSFIVKSIFFFITSLILIQLPAQTPEQKFFDWTSLQFAKEEYALRRSDLMDKLQQSGGGVFLTSARDGFSYGETFRQLDLFNYLTGLELPNAVLALDSESKMVTLFTPDRDLRFESESRKNDFPGRPLGEDPTLPIASGIQDIRSVEQLPAQLSLWVDGSRALRMAIRAGLEVKTDYLETWSQDEMMLYHIRSQFPNVQMKNAFLDVAALRMVKSATEINVMREASRITAQGIAMTSRVIEEGIDERGLEAKLEAEFKRAGSQRLAFGSIIKSGPNSLWPWRILAAHYDRRNRKMKNGELVIFDVGCELNYYSSDVGRTFPVSGKFSKQQRQVMEMQLKVSNAIIEAVKPGVKLSDLMKIARDNTPDDQEPFMQAGFFFGHHIGLSVGDPILGDVPLTPGMVFTVEPFYYNHETGISVFIEDVVLVTEDGVENLTEGLPRKPEELEKLMKTND